MCDVRHGEDGVVALKRTGFGDAGLGKQRDGRF